MTSKTLCGAASPAGWTCEGKPGHEHAEHYAGGWVRPDGTVEADEVWTGNCRRQQTRNRVLSALLEVNAARAGYIAGYTGLHRSTVYRHLRALEAEGWVSNNAGIWFTHA